MGNSNDLLFDTPGWTIKHPKNKRIKQSTPTQKAKKLKTSTTPQEKLQDQQEKPKAIATKNQLAQNLCNSKLVGSRFRILNETLYTSTGPEAFELFKSKDDSSVITDSNPNHQSSKSINQDFELYHLGFSQQVQSWPQNPVNLIANQLINQHRDQKSSNKSQLLVADLGCGQATLAKLLSKSSSSSHDDDQVFKVFSYDLVADPEGWVSVAECSTAVPLPGSIDDRINNGVMDVVVCCLSLMSTDWVGMILEARRILKLDGELRIAEVTSRFVDVDQFVKFITSIGFSNPIKDQSNTHFILFKFKKSSSTKKINEPIYSNSKQELIKLGQTHLKPCIYKRR